MAGPRTLGRTLRIKEGLQLVSAMWLLALILEHTVILLRDIRDTGQQRVGIRLFESVRNSQYTIAVRIKLVVSPVQMINCHIINLVQLDEHCEQEFGP